MTDTHWRWHHPYERAPGTEWKVTDLAEMDKFDEDVERFEEEGNPNWAFQEPPLVPESLPEPEEEFDLGGESGE